MGDITFRNHSISSLANVYVAQMPSHKKAGMRYSEYYVKGRDGAVHVDEGLANFDVQCKLILIKGTAQDRQIVNAWADGTGKLVTSDDTTLAYIASVKQEIQWSRQIAAAYIPVFDSSKTYSVGDYVRYSSSVYKFTSNHTGNWNSNHVAVQNWLVESVYDVATITFNCQPYMYEAVDSVTTLTESGTLVNPGSATALPLIKVLGSGDVSFEVNGEEITIEGMTANTPVYIDSATGYIYTDSGAATMIGNPPTLKLGDNTFTFGNNLTSLQITPHWRWI